VYHECHLSVTSRIYYTLDSSNRYQSWAWATSPHSISIAIDISGLLRQRLVSNFIPTNSKKFEFQNFNWTIRFFIKNKLEFKNEVTWPSDFWEKSIYDFETLTHNIVNMVSDRPFLIGWSDVKCFKDHLMKVWWLGDYVKWRNYEKSIFMKNLMVQMKFWNSNFLEFVGIKFETNQSKGKRLLNVHCYL